MVLMNWKSATKKQLLQIIMNEQCPIINKFEAANEYKRRDKKGFRRAIKQAKIVRHKD
jgi:hypothetical protein